MTKTLTPKRLLNDLRGLIAEARQDVARQVNSALVLLYWRIGQRIRQDILKEKRAAYGEQILPTLSAELMVEFGSGFTARNLGNMVRFAEVFPDEKILHALRAKLSWTHFRLLIYLDDSLKRDFYAEMCRIEGWNTRTLDRKIQGMLFERTALSRKPDSLIRHELKQLRETDKLTPDLVFRDPYFLDFLGLKDRYIEKDVEDAIMREMENFVLELGVGFTFVARQKRIQVDGDDYEAGIDYWSSRDFAGVLGYTDYRNFEQVVRKARMACFNSGQRVEDHFVDITEMIAIVAICAG